MKTQQVRGLECWFEMCQPQITCFFLAVKMKHKSQVRQNLKQNKRSSNHAGRNLGPSDLSPWACAGGYLTPGEMLSFAFTQLMWASLQTLGGVCIDTALLCSGRKTWSHLMLLIASWLIRFTRNCQTLKPQIIISHNKRIYCAINFLAGFPKVKSLTAVKLLLHILFLPPVRKCLEELFWSSPLSFFMHKNNNICVYVFNSLSVWNLCHSGTVKGKSSLLSSPTSETRNINQGFSF